MDDERPCVRLKRKRASATGAASATRAASARAAASATAPGICPPAWRRLVGFLVDEASVSLGVDGHFTVSTDMRPDLDRVTADVAVLDEDVTAGLVIDADLGWLPAVRTGHEG